MAAIDPSFDLALGRLGLTSSKRDAIAIEGVTNAEEYYMLDQEATEDLIARKGMGTVDKETRYRLLAFQDWLHEQANCVSLDAFTVEVMQSHVEKMKDRDSTIDKGFDKALSKIGLTANQRDAVSDQGIPDAPTYALLDKEAMNDLLTDPALVTLNSFSKYKLRAFQTWLIENPGVSLEKYHDGIGTSQMTSMKRKESGLVPLATAPLSAEENEEMKDEKKDEKKEELEEKVVSRSVGNVEVPQTIKLAKVTKKGTLSSHKSSVRSILFYERNGKGYLASCSYDKTVKIWDVQSQKEVTTLKGHGGCVNALVKFEMDGKTYLATGSNDKSIILWDLDTKKTSKLKKHASDVRDLAMLNMPNGDLLMASASSDSTIKIWNLKTKKVIETLRGHSSYVYSITFFLYGKTPVLASAGNDNKIILWDLNKNESFASFVAHPKYIWTLINFEIDGDRYIASGSADSTIKLWKLGSKENPIQTFEGHTGCVNALKFFTQNGVPCLVSGDSKGVMKFWNLRENKMMTSLELYPSAITCLTTFFSGKSHLAIGHYNDIEFWSE